MNALPVLLFVCALAVHAEAPPIDPWTDAAWQDVLFGLTPGKQARVHASQQLFNIHTDAAELLSRRDVQLEFAGPGGRLSRLVVSEASRGQTRGSRAYTYVYEAGLLRRIEEDGQATPAVTQRHDDAGRPIEHTERSGAVVARTTWRHDAHGRLRERWVDSGSGSRTHETRHYRRDGTLERLRLSSGTLLGKTIDFDADERPVRIQVNDALDRHETTVAYPSPTEAIHTTTGLAVSRDGTGRYAYTTHYRVRSPGELRGVEAPAQPTLRREQRGSRHEETLIDYDTVGRVRIERQLDASGNELCTARISYHASGPPLAVRNESTRRDAACGVQGGDIDNEIKTDEQGNWTEQRMSLARPDGQRRLMSVQTRRVEYQR